MKYLTIGSTILNLGSILVEAPYDRKAAPPITTGFMLKTIEAKEHR